MAHEYRAFLKNEHSKNDNKEFEAKKSMLLIEHQSGVAPFCSNTPSYTLTAGVDLRQ